ncbi:MAG: hypothetical protein U5J97_01635 [Trueperaceae bacterium]|nr:hypothetical protein [Trueperaceae bacterium]
MTRIRTVLLVMAVSALVLGTAVAAGVAFDSQGFDPFESEEGYVDLVLEDDVLTFVFDEEEGSLPAMMTGEALPLDDDFDDDRLFSPRALALYGGLPIGMTPTSVLVDLEGDGEAIAQALLARLDELGLEYSECFAGGPICSYDVTRGDMRWLMSITPSGTHAVVHLQAVR